MSDKLVASFAEAVRDVPDGATILLAGFGPGTPWNLIDALYQQGTKDLTLVSNTLPGGSSAVGLSFAAHGNLIEDGRVKKVIACFTASPRGSVKSASEIMAAAGKLEAELVPQGTLAERIRAGGAGIPAFFTPAGVGTPIAEGKEHRDFNGRTYIMEEAIIADYAFVRAWKADRFGNLVYRRSQRNFNPIMAMAARCTIAEVEEPLLDEGDLDPDQVHTPGIYVQRLVLVAPHGILHYTPRMAPRRATPAEEDA